MTTFYTIILVISLPFLHLLKKLFGARSSSGEIRWWGRFAGFLFRKIEYHDCPTWRNRANQCKSDLTFLKDKYAISLDMVLRLESNLVERLDEMRSLQRENDRLAVMNSDMLRNMREAREAVQEHIDIVDNPDNIDNLN